MNLSDYKAEHLLLLVGKNPLPNAVAGRLLVKPGGLITMLYTPDTAPAVECLENIFTGIGFNPPVQIREADAYSVYEGVYSALEGSEGKLVGLHYTGGTKAMSVHAYGAVSRWAKERGQQPPVFSYLDARTLEMVFDPDDPLSDQVDSVAIGDEFEVTLDELIALHGWSYKKEYGNEIQPVRQAVLPESAAALATLYSTGQGIEAWQNWKRCELSKCKTGRDWDQGKISNANLFLSNDSLLGQVNGALRRELPLQSNHLAIVTNDPQRMAQGRSLCEWLDGKWLEHHVLQCLQDLNWPSDGLELQDCCNSIRTNEVDFEVDVVAIRGYQLFAFSCGTARDRKELKLKLFEAFVRARQLGGDEARVGLVCPSDDPVTLETQMKRDFDLEGRIKVFGMDDLRDLKKSLRFWIKEQSRIS